MFERDVTISLNADVSNYSSSLSQAIAITQQYSSAADTALGSLAKMNAGLVQGLIKVSSGLTGPQRMATDTAAAYQQQLSGIQATAAVTGQSFGQLEKSTRSLARSFPIGMTQAVQQVQALQSAGVTSNKEIERLAVSFTKLGAANNSFGPELGQQMLQVTRAFGNGTSQVDALGDSLTTVSKKMGASASGVLTFSKALAPIASTVGMSQTSVMGLSAAMSRLGEDGYMAANSFNKVLLDMNRGIRDGGPELKVYADLLNMTSDSLRKMADTDPTEVLIRFTEAIGKAGPDVQRTLDALGLDGVRTTRSITALSRSGNLREAVDTAVGAYGNGSTAKAAEEAFSGVNDQMTRLTESMRQTVGSAGKPFLGFMEDVLKAGNAVSEVTNKVMENNTVQNLATAGVVVGFGGGLLMKGLAATSLGSMVMNLFRSGRDSAAFRDFQSGRMDARAGMPATAGANAATRLGSLIGTAQGPPPAPGATRTTIGERVGQTMRTATGALGRLVDADRNNIAQGRGAAAPVPMSVAGSALRSSLGDLVRNRDMASLQAAGAASRNYMGNLAATGGAGGLIARGGLYAVEGARTAGAFAGRGVMAGARFLGGLGVTPQLAAVAGVGAVGYMAYQANRETNDRQEAIRTGTSTDIFAAFNNFAEATGAAGRGLVNFTAAVNAATNNLSRGNSTFEQAGNLTGAEAAQATAPGYQRAFNIIGEASRGGPEQVDAVVQQAIATLGRDAGPDMVARVISDISNQTNTTFARQVGKRLTEAYTSGDPSIDVESMLKDIESNTSQNPFFNTTSEESATIAIQMGRSLAQESYRVSDIYDTEAGAIANVSNAMNTYDQARKLYAGDESQYVMGVDTNKQRQETTANIGKMIQSQLNLSDDVMNYLFKGGSLGPEDLANMTSEQLIGKLEQYEKDTGIQVSALDAVDLARSRGIDLKTPNYESFNEPTSVEKEAFRLQDSFEAVNDTSSSLSESLYGATAAARDAGIMLDELADRPDLVKNLSKEQQLVLTAYNDRSPANVNAAGEAMARQALRESGGNTALAGSRVRLEATTAQEGTSYKDVMVAADKLLEVLTATRQASMSQGTVALETVQQGRAAARMGPQQNADLEANRQAEIASGQQAQAGFMGQIRNFMLQKAQMDQQLRQARQQAGLQISQMTRDYNISVGRANEDFRTQQYRAERDFNIQMSRQQKDFQRDRGRARADFQQQEKWGQQDFNRQVRHATQDHQLSLFRMGRDYDKQVQRTKEQAQVALQRAERDYQKAVSRANRDFSIQMTRMEEDYKLQRTRATDDYNKSVLRANEDYTRQRGRAERDFQKQQAYAEADYLKSRTRATEDFNKQMRRLVEDSAKSLYDPYKRIQAQMVMDGGQLVANLASQNKALADQMDTLNQLRASGLSQQAIDVLNLGDTKNAQQAARLLADSMSDPALIAQLNEQIAGRVDLTQMFVTSEDNTQTRRMAEDFALQMARMEEDFKSSSARAGEQFQTAMADMAEDFNTQMTRAAEDFKTAIDRMDTDYLTAVERATADQKRALEDMAADHATALADAAEDLARVLKQMQEDYNTAVSDANINFGIAMGRMSEEYATAVERSRKLFQKEMDRQREDFERQRRRAGRDFWRQMEDAEADFNKMLRRMAQDFANAISDIGASLALAEQQALESLIGFGQNASEGQKKIMKDFAKFITTLSPSQRENMSEQMRSMLEYMAQRFPEMYRKYFPNGILGVEGPAQYNNPAGPSVPAPGASTPPYGTGPGGAPDFKVNPGVSLVTPEGVQAWKKQMEEAGKDAWQGWADGFSWANPANWVKEIFKVIVEAVKTFLWIKSPSRVFEGLGKNTIDGFVNGMTDNVPSPQKIAKLFIDMFSNAKTFFEDLPGNVKKWIGENTIFGKISDALPTMKELGDEITDRFDSAKKFFEDLPGNVLKWVGQTEIFKELKKAFPGISETKEELVDRFSGVKDFLVDLPVNVGKWIVSQNKSILSGITSKFPDPAKLKQELIDVFTGKESVGEWLGGLGTWINRNISMGGAFDKIPTAFKAALKGVVDLWNKLDIPINFTFPSNLGPIPIPPPLGGAQIRIPDIIPDIYNPFAVGGVVTAPVKGLVGEAGPEAIIPLNQRGAQVMADTLRRFIDDRVFDGALTNPYVINVDMADVNLDFSDSGSEFSQQARELLQRVKDAAQSTELFMQATGLKITEIVDDASDSLVKLAQAIEDAFGQAAEDVEADTKSIKDAVVSMNDAIETDFLSLSDALDTDLTDLTSSFSTAVDTIITETDRLISEAIARLEDFASGLPGDGGGDGGDGGGDGDGGDGGDGGDDTGGGDTGSPKWNAFSADYSVLGAPDKAFVDGLFGGKAPTAESFGALSATQQDVLHRAIIGGLTDEERTTLSATFPGGGGGGGGTPPARDLSFRNYDTLSKAVSQSDQDFLKAQFGGKAPTSSTWSKVNETQRDALIKALEDKDITSDERNAIKNLNLPNLSGGGGGSDPTEPNDDAQKSWDVFREGYRKLGDNDKNLVKTVFGGQAPTYDLWLQLTPTQQRRLRDVVRDGVIDKDEKDTVKDIDPYKMIGQQIVKYAREFEGRPYKPEIGKSPEEDPPRPPDSFDCSEFTTWVYRKFGKNLPGYSDTQYGMGRNVSREDLMAGDLMFWNTDKSKTTGHVAIYAGDGYVIHASGAVKDTIYEPVSSASNSRYVGARRYFAEGGIVNRRQDAVIGEAGPEVVSR